MKIDWPSFWRGVRDAWGSEFALGMVAGTAIALVVIMVVR